MPELTPNPFAYVAPDDKSKAKLAVINSVVKDVYLHMLDQIPDSRERSIAITKLQDVRMWANCAIVMDQMRARD